MTDLKRINDFFIDEVCYIGEVFVQNDKDGVYVDVQGSVYISYCDITEIPVRFGTVTGTFSCFSTRLTTLKNVPHTIGDSLLVHNNNLTSLEYAPRYITNSFILDGNYDLSDFNGCPIQKENSNLKIFCSDTNLKLDDFKFLLSLGYDAESIIASEDIQIQMNRLTVIKEIIRD